MKWWYWDLLCFYQLTYVLRPLKISVTFSKSFECTISHRHWGRVVMEHSCPLPPRQSGKHSHIAPPCVALENTCVKHVWKALCQWPVLHLHFERLKKIPSQSQKLQPPLGFLSKFFLQCAHFLVSVLAHVRQRPNHFQDHSFLLRVGLWI